jgi:hypothetical protein
MFEPPLELDRFFNLQQKVRKGCDCTVTCQAGTEGR